MTGGGGSRRPGLGSPADAAGAGGVPAASPGPRARPGGAGAFGARGARGALRRLRPGGKPRPRGGSAAKAVPPPPAAASPGARAAAGAAQVEPGGAPSPSCRGGLPAGTGPGTATGTRDAPGGAGGARAAPAGARRLPLPRAGLPRPHVGLRLRPRPGGARRAPAGAAAAPGRASQPRPRPGPAAEPGAAPAGGGPGTVGAADPSRGTHHHEESARGVRASRRRTRGRQSRGAAPAVRGKAPHSARPGAKAIPGDASRRFGLSISLRGGVQTEK